MKKTKTLYEIQSLLQDSIQKQTVPAELAEIILEKPPISTQLRLKIYQDAYQIRLLESLRDDFESVESALTQIDFETIAMHFIHSTPSEYQNLAEYSEKFPLFIQKNYPELATQAQTDWLEVLASHAANPKNSLSINEIQSGATFKIKLLPTSFLQNVQDKYLLAYRDHNDVFSTEVTQEQFQLLEFLVVERTLNDVSEYIESNHLNESAIMTTFQEWIKNNVLYCIPNLDQQGASHV